MKTFLVTVDNDLALERNTRGKKDLALVTDPLLVAMIKLYMRFQFFEGEWFLDTRIGAPYFRLILVKNPDLSIIRQVLRKIILSVEQLATVDRMDFDLDRATRTLSFTFEATASDGRKVKGGSGRAFIIDGREIQFTGNSEAI